MTMEQITPSTASSRGGRLSGWAAGGVMLALMAAVVFAPFLLDTVVPEQQRDRIGVYERVSFTDEGEHGAVLAGLIAPAGWSWVGSRESGMFATPDESGFISTSLRVDVRDPDALVRESLPVGASALPASTLHTGPGLTIHAVEYDLAAGDTTSLSIAVCTRGAPGDCLHVLADFAAGGGHEQDRAQEDLARMLESMELIE